MIICIMDAVSYTSIIYMILVYDTVRAIFSLMVLVIDDNTFCGLTVCLEHFRFH